MNEPDDKSAQGPNPKPRPMGMAAIHVPASVGERAAKLLQNVFNAIGPQDPNVLLEITCLAFASTSTAFDVDVGAAISNFIRAREIMTAQVLDPTSGPPS